MNLVKIVHPKLSRPVYVPESAVPHHARAGWRSADAKSKGQEKKTEPPRRRESESSEEQG